MTGFDRQSRLIEIFAVMLLAAATVASAWCAYQSSRWSGEETRLAQHSTDERVEASRLYSLGIQTVAYDSAIVAGYAEAYIANNADLQMLYRDVLARPGFVSILDDMSTAATDDEQTLGALLTDEDYLTSQLANYQAAVDRAEEAAIEGREAGENGDSYIVLTLVLAGALFFAGVTSSFRSRVLQLVLLAMSGTLLAFSVGQALALPVI